MPALNSLAANILYAGVAVAALLTAAAAWLSAARGRRETEKLVRRVLGQEAAYQYTVSLQEFRQLEHSLDAVLREVNVLRHEAMQTRAAASLEPSQLTVSTSTARFSNDPSRVVGETTARLVGGYARARASGTPVDFNGVELVPSEALEPVGLLITDNTESGSPELYINESVALNNMAFDRWARLFDFRSGTAFQRFRTIRPSLVHWDQSNHRGTPASTGVAEALP